MGKRQEVFPLFLPLVILCVVLAIPYLSIAGLSYFSPSKSAMSRDFSYRPSVTIFLPTYNEEEFIEKKLHDLLRQSYPITEILVYDCSTDRTRDLIREYASKFKSIHLIEQSERIGMASTFNEAIKVATGEIIVKTDCDSITKSEKALARLMSGFADPKVGAVTGICENSMDTESHFRSFMTKIQQAESSIDSTMIGHSTSLLAFRKTSCKPVSPNSMAEDSEEMILIRRAGFRTLLDTSVVSEEEVPLNPKVRRAQKTRRAEGIIRAILSNRDMLFHKSYGKFGFIILPVELFILCLSPFVLIALVSVLLFLAFNISFFLFILILAIVASIFIKPRLALAILDTQFNSLKATILILFHTNQPKWQKVR